MLRTSAGKFKRINNYDWLVFFLSSRKVKCIKLSDHAQLLCRVRMEPLGNLYGVLIKGGLCLASRKITTIFSMVENYRENCTFLFYCKLNSYSTN